MEQLFADRERFRAWLTGNCLTCDGFWMIFGKKGGPKSLTYDEALEEALCFGWIDSQIKSVDDRTYKQYFSSRREKSEWSARNIALVAELEAKGLMTDYGRAKIEESRRAGRFHPKARLEITEALVAEFLQKIEGTEPAYSNLLAMSPSVKRTYTGFSLEPKSDEAKNARLQKIIERLNNNLKPM